MPDPFISTADLVNYLGRGGTADPGLIIVIDSACDMCRDIAEQSFNQATSTITLDGTGTDALLLPEFPVTGAGTVSVDGTAVTDYALSDNGILYRRDEDLTVAWTANTLKWPEGRQNVTVTYDHGYPDDEIPRSVRMVALSIAARLAVQGPALQETVGGVSVRYGVNASDLTDGELRILRKYRRTS